ncbi:hypothetical protein NIES37_37560 [Tolypothrix tenuis PCC 7101]|uniref:DUF1822 family protein n=1 Tax=Tolypothrix tenuis PCC 7101 TaxID=231146 RepID=A0A1Z4N226_9CYAN|nr:DUF1822 family protein [Aulosira sp. FACHB-113]BAY99773.1 hypothetical protein NIES37_37560 [Tolypothrix tenuis PCC 7101]BAZ76305.1 hypothetical protein NIES50_49030 [Aulosira laxa NIES-50]
MLHQKIYPRELKFFILVGHHLSPRLAFYRYLGYFSRINDTLLPPIYKRQNRQSKQQVELMSDDHHLEKVFANRFRLKIPPQEQKTTWEQAQIHHHGIARHNAYINSICLHTLLNWLTKVSALQPSIVPSEASLPSIWEVVNGTAISLGDRRIVIIPTETMDLEELCVPQEWVDIPNWAADYYLAVQVNLEADEDDCWMWVCGFTTHRQLKNFAEYKSSDRTYILPAENLISNLTVMQVTLGLDMRDDVPELPTLSEVEAQNLLALLGDPSIYSPRLRVDIPFVQWASLLNNEQWRQQLYHRRIGRLLPNYPLKINNLGRWCQNIFDNGWQSLNRLLNLDPSNLAYTFRQYEIAASGLAVEGVKLIDLGMQLGHQSVALLIAFTLQADEQVAIRVQLHPTKGEVYLPPNIKLALVSHSGTILQELESRIQDNFMQLKRFTCPLGIGFKIRVSINDLSITEEFVLETPTSQQQ